MTESTPPKQRQNRRKAVSSETKNRTKSNGVELRSPETEKAKQMREQYLVLARVVVGDEQRTYADLYQQYVGEQPELQQAAQTLDRSVATLALAKGQTVRQTIQLLAQGVFTQYQIAKLSAEEKQAALPRLLQSAQAVVEGVQQQRFVEYANAVTGKVWNYPDLYRSHIGSDLAAIQLDQKVAAAALKAGESAESVSALLQQSPYVRFQREVKQMPAATLEQYARGTVAQVQEIQALRPKERESDRKLER
jgi:hypothetical protein